MPALHNSRNLKDPDLPDIGNRNYTSTILKYSNLALPFPQLETTSKTIVAAINELYHGGGGTNIKTIEYEDWSELSPEEQKEGDYVIIHAPMVPLSAETVPYDEETSVKAKIDSLVEANPGTPSSEYPALTTLKVDDVIYSISGGGSDVTPNPEETFEEYLYNIKVGDTVYSNNPTSYTIYSSNNLMSDSLISHGYGFVQKVDFNLVDPIPAIKIAHQYTLEFHLVSEASEEPVFYEVFYSLTFRLDASLVSYSPSDSFIVYFPAGTTSKTVTITRTFEYIARDLDTGSHRWSVYMADVEPGLVDYVRIPRYHARTSVTYEKTNHISDADIWDSSYEGDWNS